MGNGSEKQRFGLFSSIQHDLPSSVVVFFVAVPLCLGIALASGAPLFSGIIAGVVGGIVVGSISNSSVGVSGPAAGLTVIVLAAIQELGGFETFLLAVVIAGVLQILLGIIKAGVISHYFPSAVIKGMLSAIGIIIIMKQIPHAFGYDADYEGDESFMQPDGENTFTEMIKMLDSITPGAIIACLLALSLLLLWDVYMTNKHPVAKFIQAPLVAVVVGIAYQLVTSRYFPEFALGTKQLVSVPVAESAGDFFAQFTAPDFRQSLRKDVWLTALTIAVVASLETLLSVEATDKIDKFKRTTNTNRELIAQGSGNIVSGLLGGLPVTQVILRSSANIQSGARTKLSAILHGTLLLVCVLAIPHILNLVPLSVLAAILFVVGFKLVNPATIREMYNLGWNQFLPFVTTILGIVFTDLLTGIGLGIGVAVVVILRNSYKNSHSLKREIREEGQVVRIILAEEVFFLNKGSIIDSLNKVPDDSKIIIDMSKSVHLDLDVLEFIRDFKQGAETRNIQVTIIEKNRVEKEIKNEEYLEPIDR